MQNDYDVMMKELDAEYESMPADFSLWNNEQGIAYLEQGELEKAVQSMKEYFQSMQVTPADAEIQLCIVEKYPGLCNFVFEDFE